MVYDLILYSLCSSQCFTYFCCWYCDSFLCLDRYPMWVQWWEL
jgi:hypothetical protein